MPPSVSARQEQYVVGEASRYWTPSVELADKAMVGVVAAIKRTGVGPQQDKLRRDLDMLLERRMVLDLEQALVRKA